MKPFHKPLILLFCAALSGGQVLAQPAVQPVQQPLPPAVVGQPIAAQAPADAKAAPAKKKKAAKKKSAAKKKQVSKGKRSTQMKPLSAKPRAAASKHLH
jgi:hypothetical protein